MPRDLPLGNGDFLVTFDSRYQLRDIYYPNVGQENHTVGEPSRFGVWVDGQFAWTGDDGWDRRITYEHVTLVGDTMLVHSKLGLSLRFRDAVDFDRNVYPKEARAKEGTGRTAEDGKLARNRAAQGSIDSVGRGAATVRGGATGTGVFWPAAGKAYGDVAELNKQVRDRRAASFLARTKDYWR